MEAHYHLFQSKLTEKLIPKTQVHRLAQLHVAQYHHRQHQLRQPLPLRIAVGVRNQQRRLLSYFPIQTHLFQTLVCSDAILMVRLMTMVPVLRLLVIILFIHY